MPGGATRRLSAATASPAETAAPIVGTPPPTNTSVHGIPASSSTRERHAAHTAWLSLGGEAQRLARAMHEIWRGHPAKCLLEDNLAVAAAIVVAQDDRRIEHATVEVVENLARHRDPHLHHQPRLGAAHALEQGRQFGADDMMADADDKPALRDPEGPDCALMGGDQRPGWTEKGAAVRRQPHQPRRALQQPPAEPVFQPLDLQTHG
ncbi:MAG: hypothetical protein WDN49_05200 [Acetobacteraceae bacterium]